MQYGVTAAVENYPGMLELSDYRLCCLVWHHFSFFFSYFLSRCNIYVLFNLRVSSPTESDIFKDASDFHKLSNIQLLSQYWAARLKLVTNWFCHG